MIKKLQLIHNIQNNRVNVPTNAYIYIITEEKKPAKEESESEDDDMGFGLFD